MAIEGGAVFAEAEANITLNFESFERNTGIKNGGGMLITSRTIFYLKNVKFK